MQFQPVRRASSSSSSSSAVRRRSSGASSSSAGSDKEKQLGLPRGLKKADKLGEGGYGVVWAAVDESGRLVAVKQVRVGADADKSAVSAAKTEIAMARLLVPSNKEEEAELAEESRELGFCAQRAINSLARLYDCVESSRSLCMVFEKGGETLSKALFRMKGEFYKGERVYQIKHLVLYEHFRQHPTALQSFMQELMHTVAYLSSKGIVHGDLKPDNILVQWSENDDQAGDAVKIKVVDFGSAYPFAEPHLSGPATPEYMPPEANVCNSTFADRQQVEEVLVEQSSVHSVDMWSAGAVFLEILCGFPLWLTYKTRVVRGGKNFWLKGLFSAPGRSTEKIVARQQQVMGELDERLERYPGLWADANGADQAFDLVQDMLHLDPRARASPVQALHHPYLNTG